MHLTQQQLANLTEGRLLKLIVGLYELESNKGGIKGLSAVAKCSEVHFAKCMRDEAKLGDERWAMLKSHITETGRSLRESFLQELDGRY